MTEELRALLRAELDSERPPPIGDIVDAALRAGRRTRRNRRVGIGVGLAVLVVLAALLSDVGNPARDYLMPVADGPLNKQHSSMPSLSPETVPITTSAPMAALSARTVTTHDGTRRAEVEQKKATSAAMLHLLTELLPAGKTSHYGVSAVNELSVRLYLDAGSGPGMLQVTVGRDTPGESVSENRQSGPAASPPTATANPDLRQRAGFASRDAAAAGSAAGQLGVRAGGGRGQARAGASESGVRAGGAQGDPAGRAEVAPAGDPGGAGMLADRERRRARGATAQAGVTGAANLGAGNGPGGDLWAGGLSAGFGAEQVVVEVAHTAGDCVRTTSVIADWTDGTRVRLDIASCLEGDGDGAVVLTAEQGIAVVADPRWGVTMDADLVDAGARRFPELPVFAR